jgi:hypothetical protein
MSVGRTTVRPLGVEDDAALHSLLSAYPHWDYRAYSRMPADGGCRLLLRQFAPRDERVAAAGVWVGDALVGAGVVDHLTWDTKHFGLAMGRVGPIVADARHATLDAMDALVGWLLERSIEAGLQHLSVKVDTAEVGLVQALEASGFRLDDCLVTYFYDCYRDGVPRTKQLGTIRDFEPSDLDAVLAIADRMLGDYGGRFTSDRWLPRDAVRRFYLEWTRNACTGQMASRVLVGERRGHLAGFLGYGLERAAHESLGVRIAGHGIGAVLPEGAGLFPALLAKAIAIDRLVVYDFAEFDTSIHNAMSLRVFQRMDFHLGRSKYTLHWGRA